MAVFCCVTCIMALNRLNNGKDDNCSNKNDDDDNNNVDDDDIEFLKNLLCSTVSNKINQVTGS